MMKSVDNYREVRRSIFDKIVEYKYFLIAMITLFLFFALLYINIAPKVYRSSATLEISPKENFINLAKMNPDLKNSYEVYLQTQMDFLQSKYLISKVIEKEKLNIKFYKKNIFGVLTNLYKKSSFNIRYINIKDKKFYNQTFHIKKIDNKRYSLSLIDADNLTITQSDSVNTVFKFSKDVKSKYMDLKIERNPDSQIEDIYIKVFPINYVIDDILKDLNIVRNGDKSSFLTLSFDSNNPEVSKNFLDTLLRTYMKMIKKAKNSEYGYYKSVLDDGIKNSKKKLEEIEKKIINFSTKNRVAGIEKQTDNLVDAISKKVEKISLLNTKLETLKMILRVVKNSHDYKTALTLFASLDNKNLPILVNEIIEDEKIYNKNREKYKDLHPEMVKLKRSILKKEITLKINLVKLYKNIKLERDKLSKEILKDKKFLSTLPSKEINLDKLKREYKQIEKEYLSLVDKKSNLTILQKIKQDYIYRVIDEPFTPTYYIKPKSSIILLLSIVFGFIIGLFLILLRDFLQQKIVTVLDVEDLTTNPLLATFPPLKENMIYVIKKPDSFESNIFWHIRNNLENYKTDNSLSISISSVTDEEDRVVIASNIASTLGMGDKKSIILSLDFRNPQVYKSFGIYNQKGITSLLFEYRNINDVIKKIEGYKNLYIIPPGKKISNPTNVMNSKYLPMLINELKKVFDYIIVEVAPISIAPETIFIMKYIDLNIFSLKSKYSNKKSINIIEEISKQNHIGTLAYILTNIKERYLKKI